MSWAVLGTLSPTLDTWRTLNAPAQQELFRIEQSWSGAWPGKGPIQIRLLYANEEFFEDAYFETRRIYPTQDERLLYLPFNPVMATAGYTVRYFQARFSPRARILAAANWTITISEFSP